MPPREQDKRSRRSALGRLRAAVAALVALAFGVLLGALAGVFLVELTDDTGTRTELDVAIVIVGGVLGLALAAILLRRDGHSERARRAGPAGRAGPAEEADPKR